MTFHQLQLFAGYKAALGGVPVRLIDPRNTSRECPDCGHIDKANRRSRDRFECVSCGRAGQADTIAAENIRSRARAACKPARGSSRSRVDDACVAHAA